MTFDCNAVRMRFFHERSHSLHPTKRRATMAASVSSSGGCYPVGKDLGLGCAVRLCGLNSAKGKELNGQVGIIEGESNHRFQVKLQVKKKEVYVESSKDVLLIKPENLYLVCNCCYKDNATLKTCAGCSTVSSFYHSYCWFGTSSISLHSSVSYFLTTFTPSIRFGTVELTANGVIGRKEDTAKCAKVGARMSNKVMPTRKRLNK